MTTGRVPVSGRMPTLLEANDFSNLAAWYRADQGLGFEPGTTNVIQEWCDLSGNGRHLYQPVSASRPTLTTLANGRAALLFDGSAQYLQSATVAAAAAIAQPYTIICVATLLAKTVPNCLYNFSVLGNCFYPAVSTTLMQLGNNLNQSLLPGGTPVANLIYTAVINGATTSILRVNGGVLSSSLNGTTNACDQLTLGRHTTAAQYWNGPIEEFFLHSRILTTAEMLALERSLGVRYQITVP